jgi:hypothetical protein
MCLLCLYIVIATVTKYIEVIFSHYIQHVFQHHVLKLSKMYQFAVKFVQKSY